MFMPSAAAASVRPLTVTALPASVSGSSSFFPVTTNSSTATPDGGTAPYTYAWARVGAADPQNSTEAVSPTAATTAFRWNGGPASSINETWRVTVTDAAGFTATDDVAVSWTKT